MGIQMVGRQRTSEEWFDDVIDSFRSRDSFIRVHGYPPLAVPVIVGAGLVFLMVSLPALFSVLANKITLSPVHEALVRLDEWATDWSGWLTSERVVSVSDELTKVALLSVGAALLASLVRAIRVSSWRPVAVAAVGLVGGLLALPVLMLVIQATTTVVGWVISLADTLTSLVRWLSPFLGVVAVVALLCGVLYGIYSLVAWIHEDGLWLIAGATLVGILVLALVIYGGSLDGIFNWIGDLATAIDKWISDYVAPVVGWILTALLVVTITLGIAGITVGTLGQIGSTVILPVVHAGDAGTDQGKCTDLCVGAGLVLSLMICAAVINPQFGLWFNEVWVDTFALGALPSPTQLFDLLLTNSAADLLQPSFAAYSPVVDAGLLFLACGVGTLSLLFSKSSWEVREGSRVVQPVLLATGLAIAAILPLLILTLIVRAESE